MAKNRRTKEQIALDIQSKAKVCSTCGERKSFEEYHNKKDSPDGKHTHCKLCDYKATRRSIESNPKRYRARRRVALLKYDYGLSVEEYDKMFKEQDGKCKICGSTDTGSAQTNNLSVDHDHTTGRVRGLLCSKCNRGIGYLQDNPMFLRAAADYLECH